MAGEEFLLADLAAACEISDDELAGDLDVVVGTGLVQETGVPGRYRFAHALVREAVLTGLTSTRRAAAPPARQGARWPIAARDGCPSWRVTCSTPDR